MTLMQRLVATGGCVVSAIYFFDVATGVIPSARTPVELAWFLCAVWASNAVIFLLKKGASK